MMIIAQETWGQSWPEAAVAVGGILMVTAIAVALIWQIFKTGRTTGVAALQLKGNSELIEETKEWQGEIKEGLEQANRILADLQIRVAEIERLLKEVE